MSEEDDGYGHGHGLRRQRSDDEEEEQEEIQRARAVTAKRWRSLAQPLPDDDGNNYDDNNNNNNDDELNLDDLPTAHPLGARAVLRNPVPRNFYARMQNAFSNPSMGDQANNDNDDHAGGGGGSESEPDGNNARIPGRPMMPRGQDDFEGADMDDDLGRTRNEDMPDAEPDEASHRDELLLMLDELLAQ